MLAYMPPSGLPLVQPGGRREAARYEEDVFPGEAARDEIADGVRRNTTGTAAAPLTVDERTRTGDRPGKRSLGAGEW